MPAKTKTVEWLIIDARGNERATQHLQRAELYERQQRVRSLKTERYRVRRTAKRTSVAGGLIKLAAFMLACVLCVMSTWPH